MAEDRVLRRTAVLAVCVGLTACAASPKPDSDAVPRLVDAEGRVPAAMRAEMVAAKDGEFDDDVLAPDYWAKAEGILDESLARNGFADPATKDRAKANDTGPPASSPQRFVVRAMVHRLRTRPVQTPGTSALETRGEAAIRFEVREEATGEAVWVHDASDAFHARAPFGRTTAVAIDFFAGILGGVQLNAPSASVAMARDPNADDRFLSTEDGLHPDVVHRGALVSPYADRASIARRGALRLVFADLILAMDKVLRPGETAAPPARKRETGEP